MDKALLKERFRKAASSYETEAVTQRDIAARLWSMTQTVIDPAGCAEILEIGCGTGFLTRNYIHNTGKQVTLNDIYDISDSFTDIPKARFLIGDAEQTEWNNSFDLILSASSIQWFSNLDTFFAKCDESLNPDGIIALSTFGPQNFIEIREAGGKSLNYMSIEELTEKFSAHFDILAVKEETITLRFPDVRNILRHIKNTGVMGGLGNGASLRELIAFESRFRTLWMHHGYAPLTYHPVYLIGKKKEKSAERQ